MNKYSVESYHVLLIEDNPGDVLLITDYLEQFSSETKVDGAKTFSDAEELIFKNTVAYDVVLLDLNLPDKEGEELILSILKLVESTPVIVLTGYSDMQFSIKSLSLGVSDYILKDELLPSTLWKSVRYSIERNLASKKLQESEQRYRYLFENIPTSILIWDIESRKILDCNREASLKYGYTKAQLKSLKIENVCPDVLSRGISASGKEKFCEGDEPVINHKILNQKKNSGEIFFAEVKAHFIRYRGRKSVLFIVNDVTEKIEIQERVMEGSLQAEEKERNRIAKELHDGIVQQLVACGMYAETISKEILEDQSLIHKVDSLHKLLVKTTIQTRDISHNLKSAEFEFSTLPELLKQLVKQLQLAGSIDFTLNNHLERSKDYESNFKKNIFRSVQELCNNIMKHSNASVAIVTVEEVGRTLFISIKDDGDGFDFIYPVSHGYGLKNVESRMIRLNGGIEFSKNEKGGLQIHMEIPVEAN